MIENLEQLFNSDIRYMYDAERQLANIMPRVIEKTNSQELRELINKHIDDNRNHIGRIESVSEHIDLKIDGEGKASKGMEGLHDELNDLIVKSDGLDETVFDAALVSALQRVKHYEIASYGTLRTYANILDKQPAAEAFQEILDEEKKMDLALTEIAVNTVNRKAQ